VRFSPDGKFLAAGCGDGAIRVFNTTNGALAYNLQGGFAHSITFYQLLIHSLTYRW